MHSIFKATVQNSLHGGSVGPFNQCGPMSAMSVFAPLSGRHAPQGGKVSSHIGALCLTPGRGVAPFCSLLTATVHVCFDLFGPSQPQNKLPPAGSRVACLPGPNTVCLLLPWTGASAHSPSPLWESTGSGRLQL